MEWLWNAVMAWFGWNILAPLAFVVGFILICILIVLLLSARDKLRQWSRKGVRGK